MNITKIAHTISQDTDNLHAWKIACDTLKHIYASYGKVARQESFRAIVKKNDDYTHQLLEFLVCNRLFTYHTIKTLQHHIQQAYDKHHNITHITSASKFADKIEQQRNNSVLHDNETIGITVHNNNGIYKRNIDTDLDKLLH